MTRRSIRKIKNMFTILTISLMVFVTTQNYMITNMEISGNTGNYTVSIFGRDFRYE